MILRILHNCNSNLQKDIYARNFAIADIPVEKLTHISYAFANINSTTGEVYLSDTWADIEKPYAGDDTTANGTNVYGAVKQLYLLKRNNRALKTLLSVGGWTYSPQWSAILHDETCRTLFATSAVKLMYDLGFDGLDYDYEYINSTDQATQFIDLLAKTRAQMATYSANTSSDFLLTADVPAGPEKYALLPFKGMDKYLDFFSFMAFDYAGGWYSTPLGAPNGTYSGHSANLYGDNSMATPFNTSTGIDYYISQGVPPSKINLGNPLYGHAFENTACPGCSFNGTGVGSFGDAAGTWNYNHMPVAGSNATLVELPELGASYSYDAGSQKMISYDTPKIAKKKAEYVKDMGLGGAMWWEISMDKTGEESLVSAVVDAFAGLETSENRLEYPDSVYENLRNGFPGE